MEVLTKQRQIAELAAMPEGARRSGKVHSIYAAKSWPEEPYALIGLVQDCGEPAIPAGSTRKWHGGFQVCARWLIGPHATKISLSGEAPPAHPWLLTSKELDLARKTAEREFLLTSRALARWVLLTPDSW